MTINCLIIEDDIIYRETIRGFASKIPSLHVVATCASAMEANVYIASGQIALLFSDIEMADLSGLDFIRALKNPPYIIFITSFPNYAVEGFQVEAIDYLVKPVTFDRFLKAVNKVESVLAADKMIGGGTLKVNDDHFFIRTDSQYLKLKYDEVVHVEAYGDFVKIHATHSTIVALVNLKNVEEQFPSSLFIRVHRSFLVNISKIDSLDNTEIRAQQHTIPLGQVYKDKVYASVVDKKLVRRFSEGSAEAS